LANGFDGFSITRKFEGEPMTGGAGAAPLLLAADVGAYCEAALAPAEGLCAASLKEVTAAGEDDPPPKPPKTL
jgi:hypothetical protein